MNSLKTGTLLSMLDVVRMWQPRMAPREWRRRVQCQSAGVCQREGAPQAQTWQAPRCKVPDHRYRVFSAPFPGAAADREHLVAAGETPLTDFSGLRRRCLSDGHPQST